MIQDTPTTTANYAGELANQPLKRTAPQGSSAGGGAFSLISGRFIKRLTFFGGYGYEMSGLTVEFDNGITSSVGSVENATSIGQIDLTGDSAATLVGKLDHSENYGGGIGMGSVYLQTLNGQTLSLSNSGGSPFASSGWTPFKDAETGEICTNVVLVGVYGNAGSGMDSLGFFYKQDMLISNGMSNVEYATFDLSPPMPMNVASATVHNMTDEPQTMSISFSENVSSTYTFSTSAGLALGMKTSVTAKLPFVAEAEYEVSAEVTFDVTFGVAKSVSDTFTYSAQLTVPAGKMMRANAVASTYQMTSTYTATFASVWLNAGAITKDVTGNIKAMSAYDVVVEYSDITAP